MKNILKYTVFCVDIHGFLCYIIPIKNKQKAADILPRSTSGTNQKKGSYIIAQVKNYDKI